MSTDIDARPGPRIWVDVSYTRTERGNVGITRTVRRLAQAFAADGSGALVAFHTRGYRQVADASPGPQPAGHAPASWRDALWRTLMNRMALRALVLAVLSWLPWAVLRPLWERMTGFAHDGLTAQDPPARFGPGDLLLVADVFWTYPAWRGAQQARRAGARVVLVVHDLIPIRHPQFCFPLLPRLFASGLRRMLACADVVLANSRATEDDLRQWAAQTRQALPPTGHFRLGSDGVGAPQPGACREPLARFLAAAPACFLAVGSFERRKNYPPLVQAFESLWRAGHPARLLLIGRRTAECAAWCDALQRHPEQGRRLLVLHDAGDAEVAAAYQACQALVMPSLLEGFGLPLVEARALGRRVIASRIPSFVELADEGVTLFDPADARALARAIEQAGPGAPPPPPAARLLTWAESARELRDTATGLLAQA